MPAPDTTVKVFHNLQASAPALTAQAGTLISLLTLCLVDGFGTQTVDSIVVASGIATVTRGAGHTFDKGHVAKIAGATPAGLNGEKKVLSAAGNTYTFDAEGIPDGAASGSITHSYAPLGWTKPHTGTNIAHFRAASGNQMYLRVEDTVLDAFARGRGLEWANSISDFGGPFPDFSQSSGGLYYPKSTSNNSTARPWVLIGDHRGFYLMTGQSETASNLMYASMSCGFVFGDLVNSRIGGDPYGTASFGHISTSGPNSAAGTTREDFDHANPDSSLLGSLFVARPYHHFPRSQSGYRAFPRLLSTPANHRSGEGNQQYPNGVEGDIYLAPVYFVEAAVNTVRGRFPGIFFSPQLAGKGGRLLDRITGLPGSEFAGKDIVRINSASGFYAFDISGPWR
jgi:hypothetical protein